jgi:type VI secretion system protein ImpJ
MKNLPVHWYEGLFLRPHHFQAAERHSSEARETSQRWDHPYGYGIKTLRYSEQALANQQFQIDQLQVRMPDGTLVNLEYGQQPDRLNLKGSLADTTPLSTGLSEGFEKESTVRVYLAIPKLKLGRANVNHGDSKEVTRYRTAQIEMQDESRGGNDQELDFLTYGLRTLPDRSDPTQRRRGLPTAPRPSLHPAADQHRCLAGPGPRYRPRDLRHDRAKDGSPQPTDPQSRHRPGIERAG